MKRSSLIFLFLSVNFIASLSNAAEQENVFYSDLAREWHAGGDYFEWQSTTPNNNGARVQVFYRTFGNPDNPKLLLIHGFPNSSFDCSIKNFLIENFLFF